MIEEILTEMSVYKVSYTNSDCNIFKLVWHNKDFHKNLNVLFLEKYKKDVELKEVGVQEILLFGVGVCDE